MQYGRESPDPFRQQQRQTIGEQTLGGPGLFSRFSPPPLMVMPRRTLQKTLGFWFMFATVNGFCCGFGVNELGQLLGWWH